MNNYINSWNQQKIKTIFQLLFVFILFSSFTPNTFIKNSFLLNSEFSASNPDLILENFYRFNSSKQELNCESQFQEINGLVVMEAENLAHSPNWAVQNSVTGFTGSGYLVWLGPQYTSVPGNGLITTKIFINTPGIYQFQFRSAVGRGDLKSEHNDAWVRFPDAGNFFAEKDGIKLYPRGSGKSPTVSGAGSGGWFKAFASNLNWSFTTQTNDGNGYPIFVQFDSPGEYTMEISARSSYHLIDRIILHRNASSPRDLNKLETTCSIQPPIINVSGITVTPSNSILLVGNSQQIAANVSPTNATNKTVIWSSSNPAIANVSSNGLVSAISEGTTNITARTQDGNFTGTSTITVSPNTSIIGVTGISVNPSAASVLVGSSQQIFATVLPTNATNKSINWTSSNSSVASVSSTGLVIGISVGSALITAQTQDGDFSAITAITVNPNNSSISIGSFTLVNAGTNDDIISLVNGSVLASEQIQNLSLNFRVNTLPSLIGSVFISLTGPITASRTENGAPYSLFGDSNGNYSGRNLTAGTYTLSAIPYSGFNRSGTVGSTTMIVFSIVESLAVPVSGITTSPTTNSVQITDSQQIIATIIPSNASNKNVTWSSSNPLVATVNSTGLVTGLSVGDVIITARSEDGDFSSSSSVSVIDNNSDLNLVGHWKLEENGGNILIDHSDNGNNAILGNTSGMSWVSGQEGLALRLSGNSNSFGSVPHNQNLDFNNEITIAAWIKPSSLAKKAIISKGSPDGFFLMNQTNGKIEFRFNGNTNGTTYRLQSNQNYPTNGTWMHVAVTFNGTKSVIYINGLEDNSATYTPVTIRPNTTNLQIGAWDNMNRWTGELDEVRLYGRALNSTEITNLLNSGVSFRTNENPVIKGGSANSQEKNSALEKNTQERAEDSKFGFKVYPNPVEDVLSIKMNVLDDVNVGILVYDMMGRIYFNQSTETENGEILLDLRQSRIAAGTYLLVLDIGNGRFTQVKFIKK